MAMLNNQRVIQVEFNSEMKCLWYPLLFQSTGARYIAQYVSVDAISMSVV